MRDIKSRMYRQIVEITDKEEISVSDCIREALRKKLLHFEKESSK